MESTVRQRRSILRRAARHGVLAAITITLALLMPIPASAQEGGGGLDRSTRERIIDWVCEKMHAEYIYTDVAGEMEQQLRAKLRRGKYDEFGELRDFAREMQRDLWAVSDDEHIRVRINTAPPPPGSEGESEGWDRDSVERDRRENFHFTKLERLSGNVGYMRFDGFADARHVGPTATATLRFFAHCDALIIDLRENGGGHGNMVKFMLSYFFPESVHFLDEYTRHTGETRQEWTFDYVEGPLLDEVDLYVLIGENTFSAAESFAFALQNLGRATIIGEPSSGGAHHLAFHFLRDLNLELRVPIGTGVDPETGRDWEDNGIDPDHRVPSARALDGAYAMALEQLYMDAEGGERETLKWKWEYLSARLEPALIGPERLESFAGRYGPVLVTSEEGRLWILAPGDSAPKPMHALTETLFVVEGNEEIRGEFLLDESGAVVALKAIMAGGRSRRLPRSG